MQMICISACMSNPTTKPKHPHEVIEAARKAAQNAPALLNYPPFQEFLGALCDIRKNLQNGIEYQFDEQQGTPEQILAARAVAGFIHQFAERRDDGTIISPILKNKIESYEIAQRENEQETPTNTDS